MATLVLSTVGRSLGGPVGGIVGSFIGAQVDSSLLGGGRRREVGRTANLAVQSSAYGEAIPRLFGTMRVAGNLVWTSGIDEHSTSTGGGKRGPATASYSYSASFAVLLSARPVEGIGRVWADGKLLRDAAGAWLTPVTMRLHNGGDGQAPDPLISAAEGAGGTPAYRGLAYAVFEDLPLADYGNRIPNLTFELIARGTDAGAVIAELTPEGVAVTGPFATFDGFAAAQSGSVRDQIGPLTELYDLRYVDDGNTLRVTAGPLAGPVIADADLGSHDGSAPHEARSEARGAAGQLDDAVAIAFHDPSRDYQPGLQRAVRRPGAQRVAQIEIAAGLRAEVAKGLAAALLARRSAARVGASFRLPPRALNLRAGAALQRAGDTTAWSVRRWTFSNFVSELTVERRPLRLAAAVAADAGRVHDAGDVAAGPTTLHVLDLPPLFGEVATGARLWVAAAGASTGWRRCGLELSLDSGETYAGAGEIGAPSVIGATVSALAAGSDDRWDRAARVEVALLAPAMWLEARSQAAVLAGANLAVIGDEIVQFADVEPLGDGRFVLSTFLRGRRGSAAAAQPAGARFVLLDAELLLPVDVGSDSAGRTLRLRATGPGDGATPPVLLSLTGNALRPLPPVFARVRADGGDAVFTWTRRSRAGFGWSDGVDAPLAEASEGYFVELSAGTVVRRNTVTSPSWRYSAGERAADGTAPGVTIALAVSQLGDLAGGAARTTLIMP